MTAERRWKLLRVAQDFAPIVRPEPGVIVDPVHAVSQAPVRLFVSLGGRFGFWSGPSLCHGPFEHGAAFKPQLLGFVHPPPHSYRSCVKRMAKWAERTGAPDRARFPVKGLSTSSP